MNNILNINNKNDFFNWLKNNHNKQTECYVKLKRGKPQNNNNLYYLDAVEIALCFGWIDSTLTKIDGITFQKFTPRKKNSLWTELNKERVRRLIKLNLMQESGKAVLPDLTINEVIIPQDIKLLLIKENALENFNNFPKLYQRIRIYNLTFYKNKLPQTYEKALSNFIKNTKNNKLYGQWNDYGRLLNY